MSMQETAPFWINAAARISGHRAYRNQELLLDKQGIRTDEFLLELYNRLGLEYPKWFKMDRLSKLGLLAAELVLNPPSDHELRNPFEWGIVLANRHSSLDTDRKFVDQLAEIPSPAVFVYTLPNILIGEISIRHGFKGEQAFFIQEEFPATLLVNYVSSLLEEGITHSCLIGWADILGESYNATLYRVSRVREDSVHSMPFTTTNIYQYLYHEQGAVS
ncbi:hypothetical protein [Flavihumibacter sp. CACIAM 22H1]|uniref:hypothetical protein n=1 Tax=Flavihumibacter sp. CACIAM 22H1 TaxID=1812911 RepID=UPI0007A8F819|nr:hypothetical protein [Flavihumibacter sp. CACIAM 22H1]KYP14582.1 MAG: hypothetical protein A1D16_15945 [Flavihumibacter sp. CACIAM 22H1]